MVEFVAGYRLGPVVRADLHDPAGLPMDYDADTRTTPDGHDARDQRSGSTGMSYPCTVRGQRERGSVITGGKTCGHDHENLPLTSKTSGLGLWTEDRRGRHQPNAGKLDTLRLSRVVMLPVRRGHERTATKAEEDLRRGPDPETPPRSPTVGHEASHGVPCRTRCSRSRPARRWTFAGVTIHRRNRGRFPWTSPMCPLRTETSH